MNKLLCGTAALGLMITISAGASSAVWNFDVPVGDLGASHVYGDGVAGDPAITAMAFGPGSPRLFAKNDGLDEQGLGLTNSPFNDGEITPGSWVSLDITQLTGRVASADVSFAANSTAGGDVWHIYGSNAPGALGTSILAGTGDSVVDLMGVIGAWPFLNVTADAGPSGNGTILASEIDANLIRPSAIPEPATLTLLAPVGFGLVWLNRRRIRRNGLG